MEVSLYVRMYVHTYTHTCVHLLLPTYLFYSCNLVCAGVLCTCTYYTHVHVSIFYVYVCTYVRILHMDLFSLCIGTYVCTLVHTVHMYVCKCTITCTVKPVFLRPPVYKDHTGQTQEPLNQCCYTFSQGPPVYRDHDLLVP